MYIPSTMSTPASRRPTRVLLLGARELGRDLAFAFAGLGVQVHLVGAKEETAAIPAAYRSYAVDLTDEQALLQLVNDVQPHYVVPASDAVAIHALQRIDEAGQVCVVPSSRALSAAYSREAMRRIAVDELGLPTTKFEYANTLAEFEVAVGTLGYPCVAKPVENTGGGTSVVIHDEHDVANAWNTIAGRAIIERFVEYDAAITMLAVRSVDATTGKLCTWFCEPIAHEHDHGELVGSYQPIELSTAALDNARSVAARMTNAVGGRGLFGVELFLVGEDVYFSGVSPRPLAAGTVTRVSQRLDQAELHARAILGLPVDVTLTSPGACALATGAPTDIPTEQFVQALNIPEVDIRLSTDDAPMAMATADTVEEARRRAFAAAHLLRG